MVRFNVFSAAVLAMTAASAASAQTVVARLDGISPSRVLSMTTDGWDHDRDVRTGVNNFTVIDSPVLLTGQFNAFCIDVHQTIQLEHTYTYTVTPIELAPLPGDGMGQAKADLLRELWGRHYFDSLLSNTNGSAFQAAVWEIINDPGLNLNFGSFQMSGSETTIDRAQDWLDELNGDHAYFAPVYALTSGETQDMLVPTPGSAALLGIGGLAMLRRRR
ncbi:hypothetical protein PHYC_02977 [Phycisphaerales bacterium]|nr:hypothetical protein PHYC_02977 [Phycisphaerales bacterium]